MDIQARLQGRGPGLERWMKIHNLKEASKTLNYLTEHGITEYAVLLERAETMASDFDSVSTSIKQMEPPHGADSGSENPYHQLR